MLPFSPKSAPFTPLPSSPLVSSHPDNGYFSSVACQHFNIPQEHLPQFFLTLIPTPFKYVSHNMSLHLHCTPKRQVSHMEGNANIECTANRNVVHTHPHLKENMPVAAQESESFNSFSSAAFSGYKACN